MKRKTVDISFLLAVALTIVAIFIAFDSYATDQKQEQFQIADASASATAANSQSVDTTVSFQAGDTILPDDVTVRNTASGNAPSVFPSGNCYGGWSLALGLPGFNAGGGKAVLDEQCDMRETARMFAAVGERELAVQLLCQTEAAQKLPACAPTRQFIEDYKALKAQNDLLHEDITDLADRVERVCSETVTRGFEACQQGK